MICRRCLLARGSLLPQSSISKTPLLRQFSSTSLRPESASTTTTPTSSSPSTKTPSPLPPLSTPLQPTKPKSAIPLPVSIAPAGAILKGINFIKGRDDPVALPEEDYPEWLWRCLDAKKEVDGEGGEKEGDEFSKSKKLRRAAAKRQRKLEAAALARGDMSALTPKIPLTQQSIDLPSNESGTLDGALEAIEVRGNIRAAMRQERRRKIKENNYLKGM